MAAYIQRRLFEEIRDQLGWFPVWPVGANVQLGKVGFFHSRRKEFEWITSLEDLSINIQPVDSPRKFDEMYATKSAVSCHFRIELMKRIADFSFCRSNSLAAQGYDMQFLELPIKRLNDLLIQKINNQEIQWNYQWVILTQVFYAKGFSILMSGSSHSSASLSADLPINGGASFNIADVNLGIEASSYKGLAFQSLCKQGASPYFYVHKLLWNHGKPHLRRYADRNPLVYV
jgi:hypothetical protein